MSLSAAGLLTGTFRRGCLLLSRPGLLRGFPMTDFRLWRGISVLTAAVPFVVCTRFTILPLPFLAAGSTADCFNPEWMIWVHYNTVPGKSLMVYPAAIFPAERGCSGLFSAILLKFSPGETCAKFLLRPIVRDGILVQN